MKRNNLLRRIPILLILILSEKSLASGIYIPYQSAADTGDAFAGEPAAVRDASTNYFNPAGLIFFHNQQAVFSLVNLFTGYTFRGTMSNPGLGAPTFERGSASSPIKGNVPAFHYVYPYSDKLAFGVSFQIPSGLGYDYAPYSVVRYDAYYANQASVSLNPGMGYRLNDQLSVGFGLNLFYTRATTKLMVRTAPLSIHDSEIINKVSGYDAGWRAGLLYQLSKQTRFGIAYQSRVMNHLYGSSRFYSNGFVPNAVSTSLKVVFPLASLTSAGFHHEINPQWTIDGNVQFMDWSQYKYDRAYNVASPIGSLDVVSPRKLRNTWLFALGTSYKVLDCLIVRGGYANYQGATTNQYRALTLPDPSQNIFALGVHYQQTRTAGWDVAALYGIVDKVRINHLEPRTGDRLNGQVTNNGFTLGAQLTWDII